MSTVGLARPKNPFVTLAFSFRQERAELPGRALAWGEQAIIDLGKSPLEFRIFLEQLSAAADDGIDEDDDSWLDSAIDNRAAENLLNEFESESPKATPAPTLGPSFIDVLQHDAPVETGRATFGHALELLLKQGGESHLLSIWNENRWWYLFSQAGRVVRAYVRPVADWSSVLKQLTNQGRLDAETAACLGDEAHEQKLPEDFVLSKSGLVPNRVIEKTCEAQVRFALSALCKQQEVEFSICPLPSTPFRQGSAWRTGAFNLAAPDGPQGLFKSRVKAYLALSRDEVRDMLEPHLDARPRLSESAAYISEQVGLPDSAVRFIQSLDGSRPLKQFMRSGSMRQEHAFSLLFALLDAGFVKWPGAPEPHVAGSESSPIMSASRPTSQPVDPRPRTKRTPPPRATASTLTPVPVVAAKEAAKMTLEDRINASASKSLFTRLGVAWFASRDEIQRAASDLVRQAQTALNRSKVDYRNRGDAQRIVAQAPRWAAQLSSANQRRAHRREVVDQAEIDRKLTALNADFSKALEAGDRSLALGLLASFKELDPDLGRVRHTEAARRF